MSLRSLFLIPALFGLPLAAQVKLFRVDPNHTVLGFKASTPIFDVPGHFGRHRIEIQGDPVTLANLRIRVELEARSIDTANRTRDEHLRSADFFEVTKYPKITFVSDKAWKEGDRVIVRGTLSLHGVSKELDLPFVPAQGMNGAGVPTWSYRAQVPLNRLDFGLGAASIAARISLKEMVALDLLLVGFFEDPAPARKNK